MFPMWGTLPTVRRLLTAGILFLLIGGTILTFSHTSNRRLLADSYSAPNSLEPPIYPKPGQEFSAVCNVSLASKFSTVNTNTPMIYVVTPTYTRREQIAELTRLGQTLLNVPNVFWIISEDSESCSPMVEDLLQRMKLPYTHIISPMPKMFNSKAVKYKPRGVSSRRAAMKWILKNYRPKSILYFADDDNSYDLRIFEEIRKTKKVSVFPVGFIGVQGLSSPIVETRQFRHENVVSTKKVVVGFSDDWFASRKFPVDMAGFAVNVEYLASCDTAAMPYKAGYEEDYFLQSLNVTFEDLEPLADGCTQVLVWHTQAVKKKVPNLNVNRGDFVENNLAALIDDLTVKGVVKVSASGKRLKVCRDPKGCD